MYVGSQRAVRVNKYFALDLLYSYIYNVVIVTKRFIRSPHDVLRLYVLLGLLVSRTTTTGVR